MNLYDYLERNVNLDKISELNGDMYEMAELKYSQSPKKLNFIRAYQWVQFYQNYQIMKMIL